MTSPEFLKGLTEDQAKVIETPTQNILVSAAAGSGKTFVLTKRITHLIKDLGYSLDNIVVLTFTDLAAKEMKDRIIDSLSKSNDEKLKEELAHIDEASICTFDSFCHKFLVENSIYSVIPSNFNMGDAALFEMVAEEALDEILNDYAQDEELSEGLNRLIKREKISKLYSLRSVILNIYWSLFSLEDPMLWLDNYFKDYNPAHSFNKFKELYNKVLDTKLKTLLKYDFEFSNYSEINDSFIQYKEYIEDVLSHDDFEERVALINKGLPSVRFSWSIIDDQEEEDFNRKKVEDFKSDFKNGIKEKICKQFSIGIDEFFKTYVDSFCDELTIVSILGRLFTKVREYKDDHLLYTFQDIEIECINILLKHPEICDRYKKNVKEFLIDEYQDTNDIQEHLISLISNNNVVVVGDVKQSIYRFRNANPDLFKEKYNKYDAQDGGKLIKLSKNFRSRQEEVLDVCNNIFEPLSKDNDLDSKFFDDVMSSGNSDYVKYNEDKELNKFRIIEYPKDEDEKKENQFKALASDIIKRIASKQKVFGPYYDEEGNKQKGFREIKYSDIMILCRTQKQFANLKKVLEEYGIPSQIIAEEEYSSSEEIIFLKNALNVIYLMSINKTNTEDFTKSILSLLRSFVLKQNDNKIMEFIADNRENKEKLPDFFPELSNNLDSLLKLYSDFGVSKLISETVKTFELYKKLMSLDKKEARELKISILINQIDVYAKSGLSLEEIIHYFNYLKNNSHETLQKLNNFDSLDCVTIMTIHKSKGLEAPLVYVIGLNRELKLSGKVGYYSNDLGICLKSGGKKQLLNFCEVRETSIELFRLLYVALTRPRESLTLLSLENNRESLEDVYSFKTLMGMLNYAYEFKDVYEDAIFLEPEKNENKLEIESKEAITYNNLILEEKKLIVRKHASHEIKTEVSEEVNELLDKGTLLHSIFETIDFLKPIDEEIERKQVADDCIKYVKAFSESDLFKTKSIREFHELPYYQDNTNGIIDYLLEKENEYIIVDFKTSNIDNPAYVNQLNTYKDYLKTKTEKPIKMYLYSILKNTFKKIEDN